MYEFKHERLTGEFTGVNLEDRIYQMCFHNRETYSIMEEAENVCVLWEKDSNEVHVVVYIEQWKSCRVHSLKYWTDLSMAEKLQGLRERLGFLRQMQE